MDWSYLPSDPHAGEGRPNYEYEERLENENKLLKEEVQVYEEILDFYGHLEEARGVLEEKERAVSQDTDKVEERSEG